MNEIIKNKFDSYPEKARKALLELRESIFSLAEEKGLGEVTEDLKWGQLTYATDVGSPVRIDWCENAPNQLSIYFHCQTTLVATFREIYPAHLNFQVIES